MGCRSCCPNGDVYDAMVGVVGKIKKHADMGHAHRTNVYDAMVGVVGKIKKHADMGHAHRTNKKQMLSDVFVALG